MGQRAVGGGHDPYATAAGWAALDVNDAIVSVKLDAHRHRGGVTETAALRTVFSVRQSAALAPRQAVGDDACRPARRVRPRWTGYCWCASLHDVSTLVQREHARGAAPPGSWRRAA